MDSLQALGQDSMNIEDKANDFVVRFSNFQKWEDRYREIIQIGKSSPSLEESEKLDKYLVKGCQSQVWLISRLEGNRIYYKADSDSFLVKGIINILVQVYSGSDLDDVINYQNDFLSKIGISEHLSMNRSNGLASMVKQIKLYAIAYKATIK